MSDPIEKTFVIPAPCFQEAIESVEVPKIGTRYILTEINGVMIQPGWCKVKLTIQQLKEDEASE
jgi:hypothetical protein